MAPNHTGVPCTSHTRVYTLYNPYNLPDTVLEHWQKIKAITRHMSAHWHLVALGSPCESDTHHVLQSIHHQRVHRIRLPSTSSPPQKLHVSALQTPKAHAHNTRTRKQSVSKVLLVFMHVSWCQPSAQPHCCLNCCCCCCCLRRCYCCPASLLAACVGEAPLPRLPHS
jgi:hypothetical protein